MINIINAPNNFTKKELKPIMNFLKADGYSGTITFNLARTTCSSPSLVATWNKYAAKAMLLEPEMFMSDWSPNNGTHQDIIQALKSNELYKGLHENWYENGSRHQTIELLYVLDDLIWDILPEYDTALTQDELDGDTPFITALEFAEANPDDPLSVDVQEVVKIFLKRNPSFTLDW